jgi:FAD/FMN-containing dehydrogenase
MLQQQMIEARTTNGATVTLDSATIDAFGASLQGDLLRPDHPDYDRARRVWNGMIDKHPALIARCYSTEDVVTAVNFAREHQLVLAVRGGGHNAAGNATCDDGLVIDLSPMRGVEVDPDARLARAQGGATWADLDTATQVYGLATPGGAISTTGIGGLTLGGGLGHLRRKHGLTIDNLRAVEIVTADGQVRTASETQHPDLFWALRGGGGNFGVVTRFTYDLYPVGPEVLAVLVIYPLEDAHRVIPAWRDVMRTAPDELSCNGFCSSVPPAPMFPEAIHGRPVFVCVGMYAGNIDEGLRVVQPLHELGTPLLDGTGPMPYSAMQTIFDPLFPAEQLQYYWKLLYISELTEEAIQTMIAWSSERPSPMSIVDLWAMGGAASRVSADATAFGDRSAECWMVFNTTWADPAAAEENIAWTRAFWEAMRPYSNGRVYLNFPGIGDESEQMDQTGQGATCPRLVQGSVPCSPPKKVTDVQEQLYFSFGSSR